MPGWQTVEQLAAALLLSPFCLEMKLAFEIVARQLCIWTLNYVWQEEETRTKARRINVKHFCAYKPWKIKADSQDVMFAIMENVI